MENNSYFELCLESALSELFRLVELIIDEINEPGIKKQAQQNLAKFKRLSDNFLVLSLTWANLPYTNTERKKYIEENLIFTYLSRDIEKFEPKAWKTYQKLSPKILEAVESIYKALY
jgi:hypothetical protein